MSVALRYRLLRRSQLLLLKVIDEVRSGCLKQRSRVVLVGHHVVYKSPDIVVHQSIVRLAFSDDLPEFRSLFIDLLLVG